MEKITVMEQLTELGGYGAVTNSSLASRGEPGKAHGKETSRSSESSFEGREQADTRT